MHPTGLRAPVTQQDYEERTLTLLEEYDVLAVASGPIELVRKWKAASPDRIIPGLFFRHPSEYEVERVRDLVVEGEISVLGEIVAQSEGLAPGDPLLEPYFALAEELDIPVALHMGMGGIDPHKRYPRYRSALSDPLLLEEVLLRHPNLRIYVMHAGWPMLDEMVHLMWSHSKVYVDTGVIDWVIPRKKSTPICVVSSKRDSAKESCSGRIR
jgi:predicted TIM-barrel fold metal-dependent hydrolase